MHTFYIIFKCNIHGGHNRIEKAFFIFFRLYFDGFAHLKDKEAPRQLQQIEEAKVTRQLDQTLSFELRTTQTRINAPLPHRPFLLSFRPVPLPPG